MIFLVFRILIIAGLVTGVYFIIRKVLEPSDFVRCGRCDGKGFWYAARGKEICDWCKGSGKLPRK